MKKIAQKLLLPLICLATITACNNEENSNKKQETIQKSTTSTETSSVDNKDNSDALSKCRKAVETQDKNAHALCLPLANAGNSEAQFLLSIVYDKGLGVNQDPNQQIRWLVKAQNGGNLQAEVNLGIIGIAMYTRNHVGGTGKQALFYLQDAASRGSLKARTMLARIKGTESYKDLGVYNPEESHNELLELSNLDIPEASVLAAQNFITGFGTKINHTKALEHFEKAAKQGIPQAYYALSQTYLNNENFKDISRGYSMFYAYTWCFNSSDNMRTLSLLKDLFKDDLKALEKATQDGEKFVNEHGCHNFADYEKEEFDKPRETSKK